MKTLEQIAGTATLEGDGTTPITGISCNSQTVKPGTLFAALPGTKVDGAKFIGQALENGAAAILVAAGVPHADFGVPCLVSKDPRKDLALVASRFFDRQPETIIAVTGTNGKTSVASFVRQIWTMMGINGASLGTVGIETKDQHWPLSHTTPDPVELHEKLAMLVDEGVTHLAIEASSHGLEQRRLDGLKIKAAGFTNITQDHLDYHGNMEDYFAQKLRLFRELLPKGGSVIVDTDIEGADQVLQIASERGQNKITVGRSGATLKLADLVLAGYGQDLLIAVEGRDETFEISSKLMGDFQASNLLVAAGLAMGAGRFVARPLEKSCRS